MKKQYYAITLLTIVFLYACNKDSMNIAAQTENPVNDYLNGERTTEFVAFACTGEDENGNGYAGTKCQSGGGECVEETACIKIPDPGIIGKPTNQQIAQLAEAHVDELIHQGVFKPSKRAALISKTSQSLRAFYGM